MKLYRITNIKTGKVTNNLTDKDIAALRAVKTDVHDPNMTLLNRFTVEDFETKDPKGVSFRPPWLDNPTAKAVDQDETTGSAAADQTTDSDAQNG